MPGFESRRPHHVCVLRTEPSAAARHASTVSATTWPILLYSSALGWSPSGELDSMSGMSGLQSAMAVSQNGLNRLEHSEDTQPLSSLLAADWLLPSPSPLGGDSTGDRKPGVSPSWSNPRSRRSLPWYEMDSSTAQRLQGAYCLFDVLPWPDLRREDVPYHSLLVDDEGHPPWQEPK